MKNLVLIALAGTILCSCNIRNSGTPVKDVQLLNAKTFTDSTTVQVIDSVYNFNKVTDGEKVEYNFRFKNTGNKPLIIADARASCGCTVPEKPEAPIAPGEMGFMKVVFNSAGKSGDVVKTITVTSNAYPAFPVLTLKGEVLSK